MKISLNKPLRPDLKKLNLYLEEVNQNGWYTNFGPLHQQLTKRLEKYLGVKNLLLVSNGTVALQVASKVLGIDNAITTPYSFVATTSALMWQNIKTQFCDIDRHTFNLSPEKTETLLKKDNKINGIVATHVYGNPVDIKAFEALSKKYNVSIVYDAAHAFGVNVHKESLLNFGDASTLSFHATKIFHTIEGGAIIFRKDSDFQKAQQLINFGLDQGQIKDVGINAKLNEYQSAVGLTILDEIDNVIDHRVTLFKEYKKRLESSVQIQSWLDGSKFNGAYFAVALKNEEEKKRVKLQLETEEVESRDYFSPSLNNVFGVGARMPVSESLASRVLCLPLHYYLKESDVKRVCKAVLRGIEA